MHSSYVACQVTSVCLTFCNPMDYSPPGSSVHGDSPGKNTAVGCHALLQGIFPNPRIKPASLMSPALAGRFFTTSATWEAPMWLTISVCKYLSKHIELDVFKWIVLHVIYKFLKCSIWCQENAGHYEACTLLRASLVAQMVKHLPAMWETRAQPLGREDPLEKEMATHSSTLPWQIPWMKEPGRLQSMGSQSRTRLSDFTSLTLLKNFFHHLNTICSTARSNNGKT